MKIKQISVFLENKWGRLAEVTNLLGENEVNIRALCIADTSDFGILRMIVDNPKKAYNILLENEYTVSQTDVIAVEVEDRPGGLAKILNTLKERMINIEYLYCFIEKSKKTAINIMRIEDIDKTIVILKEKGIKILTEEEIYNI